METVIMKISDVERATYNPRVELKPGNEQFESLRKSIQKFGLVQPIVWNKRTNRVVGGHQRLSVLEDEGHEEAVFVVVDLDDSEEKALNLSLNKTGGFWDEEKLEEVLRELSEAQEELLDFTGFDEKELSDYLQEEEELDFEEEELDIDEDDPEKTVRMIFPLTVDQRAEVTEALKSIKPDPKMSNSEALLLLARHFMK